MKKKMINFIALTLTFGGALGFGISKNAVMAKAANGDVGGAEYVSVEDAPIIDGIMDDVWSSTYELTTDEEKSDVFGYISILWNETGLYFYAEIIDATTNASDRCNFWVSETFYGIMSNDMVYPSTDGAYYLCLNPYGENQYYLPGSIDAEKYVDMRDKYQVATQVYEGNGYAIELYVPLFGCNSLEALNSIGFNVSVDDYHTEDGKRVSYTYWCASGSYWEDPSALGEVVLLNSNQSTTPPDDSSSGNSGSSTDSGNDSSVKDEQTTTSSENGVSSCFSSITLLPMSVAVSFVWVLLKKKED